MNIVCLLFIRNDWLFFFVLYISGYKQEKVTEKVKINKNELRIAIIIGRNGKHA